MCASPGNDTVEKWIAKQALGKHKPLYTCDDCIVYRLASPAADHYFFLNDSEEKKVKLDTGSMKYRAAEDPITGQKLKPSTRITVPAYSGRWVRMVK